MEDWPDPGLAEDEDWPDPPPPEDYPKQRSGRLLLRMSPTLHDQLAWAAMEEGLSLNMFICSVLAGAVQWRAESPDERRAREARASAAAADKMWSDLFR